MELEGKSSGPFIPSCVQLQEAQHSLWVGQLERSSATRAMHQPPVQSWDLSTRIKSVPVSRVAQK